MRGQACPPKLPCPTPALLPASVSHWLGISSTLGQAGFLARDLLCEATLLPTLTPSLVLSCGPLHSAHTSLLAVRVESLILKTQILNMVSGVYRDVALTHTFLVC